jgi:pimeloyl-ACP methyl ester carboxylesterase
MSETIPTGADHRTIETNGVQLHALVAGPTDGHPIVLLHGFPEFWYGWRHQISALADAGYRVVVPDQRGYNRSEKPAGIAAYAVDELAADAVGVIEALEYESAIFVGHDWGAGVLWQTLLRYPERVDRAVVANVPHPEVFEDYLPGNLRQLLDSWYMFFFQLPWIPERTWSAADWRVLRWFIDTSNNLDTFSGSVLDRYRDAWSRPGAFTGMLNWYRALFRVDVPEPSSKVVEPPTMVVWGMQDAYLHPRMAEDSFSWCANGRLERFEDATHWVHHEAPERFTDRVLDFLS